MRLRWSLFARIAAVVAVTLVALQLVLVALYLSNRGPGAKPGYRFPLPERVAAMVLLFEAGGDPGALIAALSGPDIVVSLTDEPLDAEIIEETRIPSVERALARYADSLGDRPTAAFIAVPDLVQDARIRLVDRSLWSDHPLRIAVRLSSGQTLIVESRDDLVTQVYALPVGFWAGILALCSAVVVLFVIRRETRPLQQLAMAAEAFGHDETTVIVPERGAAELRDLIAAFNRMQARIAELMRGRTVMLGALGHDLRTYLTRLQLKAHALGPQSQTALQPDLDRIGVVLENCLTLARDPHAPTEGERIVLGPYLRDFIIARAEDREQLCLETDVAQDAAIRCERAALDRALNNVVENALRHGQRVRLTVRNDPGQVEIIVSDDGPGLPPGDFERVLKPFESGTPARTRDTEGSGLGLAIAKALVERNGGALRLSAAQEGGLAVGFRFAQSPQVDR